METKDLDTLVTDMTNGDLSALDDFYTHYANDIAAIAYTFLHNKTACEDVVNDVMISVWNNAQSHAQQNDLKPIRNQYRWLYTVVKHHCLNVLKKKTPEQLHDQPANVGFWDEKIYGNIQYLKMTSSLNQREQTIVTYKIILKLHLREIGELIDMPTRKVSKIYYRALKKLKKLQTPPK